MCKNNLLKLSSLLADFLRYIKNSYKLELPLNSYYRSSRISLSLNSITFYVSFGYNFECK